MAVLKLRKKDEPALTIERDTASALSAVYLLTANKPQTYSGGKKSKVVYVGKTDRGMTRVHESAALKASTIFRTPVNGNGIPGVVRLRAYTYSFQEPASIVSWPWVPSVMLERAFLLRFKDMHGQPPLANDQRNAMVETVEFDYFGRDAIDNVLMSFW